MYLFLVYVEQERFGFEEIREFSELGEGEDVES